MNNAQQFANPTTQAISAFLWQIGLPVHKKTLEADTFLPGIRIVEGQIWVDEDKMLSPGDILHEAGHLAILPKEIRNTLTDTVVHNPISQGGEEMAAIAWSWAAMLHLNISPEVVFHERGYKGDAENIITNFSEGRYFGVPLLAYKNLCDERETPAGKNDFVFPKMKKWIID